MNSRNSTYRPASGVGFHALQALLGPAPDEAVVAVMEAVGFRVYLDHSLLLPAPALRTAVQAGFRLLSGAAIRRLAAAFSAAKFGTTAVSLCHCFCCSDFTTTTGALDLSLRAANLLRTGRTR